MDLHYKINTWILRQLLSFMAHYFAHFGR